jgi:hypothetical protein
MNHLARKDYAGALRLLARLDVRFSRSPTDSTWSSLPPMALTRRGRRDARAYAGGES